MSSKLCTAARPRVNSNVRKSLHASKCNQLSMDQKLVDRMRKKESTPKIKTADDELF